MGQPFILSELYGVAGWEFDWAGHKYVGDWQALFGVNLRCHHLSWYTMQGQAKRDYPASMLHQSSWYSDYDYVESYFARLGYLLSQGKEECHVLVVNPVESVWNRLRHGWANGLSPNAADIRELEEHYADLFFALQGAQIDFDYGDEDILMRHASVGRGNGGEVLLKVGEASYRTVVLGKMTTIRSSTLELLKGFKDAGGIVILAGEAPENLDGSPSEKPRAIESMAVHIPSDRESIASTVRDHTPIPVEALDPATGERIPDIYCQVKRDGERTILAAMNMSREKDYPEVLLKIDARGEVCEWDCRSGEVVRHKSLPGGNSLEIRTAFEGPEEHLYTISPEPVPGASDAPDYEWVSDLPLSGPFAYTLDEPNLCVLDMGYVEIDGEMNPELLEILKIDQLVRDHYQVPRRAGNMVQPWFSKKFEEAPQILGKVSIRFPFHVEEIPGEDLEFCMETPHEFKVMLNGEELDLADQGWWVDKAIRKFTLPGKLLRQGENVLVQEFDFRADLDLEALYLLGAFSVRLEGSAKVLAALPDKISTGNICNQGFPFYSGRIRYHIPLLEDYSDRGKVLLEVPDYGGACIKVNPDGPGSGYIAWKPNRMDVSEALRAGRDLTLELVLTRRNAFGPLHHFPLNTTTGPGHFTTSSERFSPNYVLYPSGILESPRLHFFKQRP